VISAVFFAIDDPLLGFIAPVDKYRNPGLVGALLAAPQGGASAAPTFQCLIAAAK
jgi:hypothetical protein